MKYYGNAMKYNAILWKCCETYGNALQGTGHTMKYSGHAMKYAGNT